MKSVLNAPTRATPARARCWVLGLCAALLLAACSTAPEVKPGAPRNDTAAVPVPPAVPEPPPRPPLKVGLALGGGAARGFAHIGVIQVLEEAGIKPDLVVGTSAGSVVAALYASGKTGPQMQQVAETMEEAAITDWTLPLFSRGMLKGEALARYVNNLLGNRLIEDMKLPLGVVATDLQTGQGVLFRRGNTGTAVRASSAVPSVFQPVSIGGHDYVDGVWYRLCRCVLRARWGRPTWSRWISPARRRAIRPMIRCRSCCKPLRSCPRASTTGSSKRLTWWFGLHCRG